MTSSYSRRAGGTQLIWLFALAFLCLVIIAFGVLRPSGIPNNLGFAVGYFFVRAVVTAAVFWGVFASRERSMKAFAIAFVAIYVSFVSTSFIVGAITAESPVALPRVTDSQSHSAEATMSDVWLESKASDGSFVVSMPGQAIEETSQATSLQYGSLPLRTLVCMRGTTSYSVSWIQYPANALDESDPDEFLDSARDGSVAAIQGSLLTEERLRVQNHPAREMRVALANNSQTLIVQTIMCGNTVYQVGTVRNVVDAFSPDARHFIA